MTTTFGNILTMEGRGDMPRSKVARRVPHRDLLGVRKSCGKREVLFRQGDAANHLFRIIEGAVALERYLEDGRRQLVELLLPGDICGLSADGVYSATGIALQASTYQTCRTTELIRHSWLGWEMFRQFQAQLCKAHEHIMAVGRMGALERVSALLFRLAEHQPSTASSDAGGRSVIPIHIPLTRGEMGDYLGLSLETVCRVMSDLERRGIIEIGRHHGDLVIRDLPQLQRMIG